MREGDSSGDGAGWVVLQETEAGIAMGGVEHYYCTPLSTAAQPEAQPRLGTVDPLRAGRGCGS